MDAVTLNKACQALIEAQLIAYGRPLYQALALDPLGHLSEREGRRGELRSIQALLAQTLGETP